MPASRLALSVKSGFALGFAVLLAGCSLNPGLDFGGGAPQPAPQANPAPALTAPITPAAVPAAQTAKTAELALTDIASYLDPAVVGKLSAKDKTEAASAQFNALTFGRPGAPRAWAGDSGATGTVTVGPYVRVNNIDCRDFTHTVTVGGTPYVKKGTACRDATGAWSVAS